MKITPLHLKSIVDLSKKKKKPGKIKWLQAERETTEEISLTQYSSVQICVWSL